MYCNEQFLENCQPVDLKVTLMENLVDELTPNMEEKASLSSVGFDCDDVKRSKTQCEDGVQTKKNKQSTIKVLNNGTKPTEVTDDEKPLRNLETDENVLDGELSTDPEIKPTKTDNKLTGKKTSIIDKQENNAPVDRKEHNGSRLLPDSNEPYILDIDLDYFTVTNPFLQDYTQVCNFCILVSSF